MSAQGVDLVREQLRIVRDALTTMLMMDDGFYEDEAARGLDALEAATHELGLDALGD